MSNNKQNGGGGSVFKASQGFTLAEVLITLGIVGIVAALTLPGLVTSYKERVVVTKLKKAYSALSQAYLLAQQEHGEVSGWFSEMNDINDRHEVFFNNIKPYLKVSKECGVSVKGCLAPGYAKNFQGDTDSSANYETMDYKFIMSDGILVILHVNNIALTCKDNEPCAAFRVDVDGGFKGPYTYGKDIFHFGATPTRVYPLGMPDDTNNPCSITSTSSRNGMGCAAWVLSFENMDYLHCDELSWDGKKKCD
jgi:prepilin-type N-terminal cleavage/methylation domain-containing protein